MKNYKYFLFAIIMSFATVFTASCKTSPSDGGTTDGDSAISEESIIENTENGSAENDGNVTADGGETEDEDNKDGGTANGEEEKVSEASFTKSSITVGSAAFNFWLYTPQNAQDGMPLIVYLHGGSGKGSDLDILTANDGFPKYLSEGDLGDVGAYVVIPQLASAKTGWTDVKENIRALINYMVNTYGIDSTNVSLTGHSMGGTGTWCIAVAYPKLFARIAPLSGSIKNTAANRTALANMPVWVFVGSADTIVAPSYSTDFIAELSKTNAVAKCTVIEDAGHFDVPSQVYLNDEYNLIGWLISGNG